VKQFADESELCDFYLNELVVFNDPDDKEYIDEDTSEFYLNSELLSEYVIFKGAANGEPKTFIDLYFHTARVDVVKIYAFNLTYKKQQFKIERIKYGR